MCKDPAFLLYSSDFLIGCSNLTMTERGQYITLLCLQHQKGHLNKKTIELSVGDVSEDVMAHFQTDEEGLYFNEKLDGVIAARNEYSKSRSENGRKGGRPKKESIEKPYENHMKTICESTEKAQAKAYKNHSENENINENIIYNIFEYWNTKNIIKHRELKKDTEKAILNALKMYSVDEIKTCIDRYEQVLHDSSYFFDYVWSLKDFLKREDGISSFTDEGSKWVSYCSCKEKAEQGEGQRSDGNIFRQLKNEGVL